MASKPLWDLAEKEFEGFFPSLGAYVYAFEDTREAQRTGGSRRIFTKARPSDYLVTHEGLTFFAEVKYTDNETSFPLGNIAKEQWSAAMQSTLAGGLYFFFIKSGVMKRWYKVPASVMLETFKVKKSLKWSELESYVYRTTN